MFPRLVPGEQGLGAEEVGVAMCEPLLKGSNPTGCPLG